MTDAKPHPSASGQPQLRLAPATSGEAAEDLPDHQSGEAEWWFDEGFPGEVTIHILDYHGGDGSEQHVGSITFPGVMPGYEELERMGVYEMAARAWNVTVALSDMCVQGRGWAVSEPGGARPIRSAQLDSHPVLEALAKILASVPNSETKVDVDEWARRDT